jgi:uncharacterized membrane protein
LPVGYCDFTQRIGSLSDAGAAFARDDAGMAANPEIRLDGLVNPALIEEARKRRQSIDDRIADRVTAFSGSMRFVWLHVLWFACWIGFAVEAYPYGLLTMIVSLESIFLSTFVMISQNRADSKRQVLANQEWRTVQDEDRQNQELIRLSQQILDLTKAVHAATAGRAGLDGEARAGTPTPST